MKKLCNWCLSIVGVALFVSVLSVLGDMQTDYQQLARTPAASGVDFLMFGVPYGLGCLFASLFGLGIFAINRRLARSEGGSRVFGTVSAAGMVLCGLCILVSVAVFFL